MQIFPRKIPTYSSAWSNELIQSLDCYHSSPHPLAQHPCGRFFELSISLTTFSVHRYVLNNSLEWRGVNLNLLCSHRCLNIDLEMKTTWNKILLLYMKNLCCIIWDGKKIHLWIFYRPGRQGRADYAQFRGRFKSIWKQIMQLQWIPEIRLEKASRKSLKM